MNLLLLNTPATGGKLEQALEKLIDFGMDAGKDILIAILIYVIGRFIIRQISVLVARILEKRKIETSVQTFLKSLIKILLNMILAFAIIGKLGVETTSFAALLASAGVAVGMALSGNLSNFAGGLIILIFKPFKVGDYIDGPGVSGTIKEIQIFHTILSTLDNRMIYVPNGSLSGNAVTNYSKQDKRRVEWVFGVEYGEDVKRVRAVLQRIINADSRILDTPAPLIVLGSLSASSVDITVRVWVKSADYWSVLYDINEIVYQTFNEEGIGFPFPQLTVHQSKSKKQRMFPKRCVLPQSGNILLKYPLQISPARFRPGTGSFLSAGNYLPCPGTQHRTDKRAYNENPQLAQSLSTLKERRAYTASRINRSTGITDAGQMYKYQRETYGKSGKITGALLGIGSAQYHQYKHKCKHNLGQ